jgi:uncharacterized membrane protein
MPDNSGTQGNPRLPSHVEEAVRAVASMHVVHEREATQADKAVDRLTSAVGRPSFLAAAVVAMAGWVLAALLFGKDWPDGFPFPLLNLLVSCVAICIAILILTTQKRADRLVQRRQQLALEVALLAENKASKIIDLIEELRRDLPNVHNRVDLEAIEMASKPDHETVMGVIEERTAPEMVVAKAP